jgi:hypothetical protein
MKSMLKIKTKRFISILFFSLLIIFFTNPTMNDFTEFLPNKAPLKVAARGDTYYLEYHQENYFSAYRKKNNYLFFSLFQRTDTHFSGIKEKSEVYLGVLKNFYLIEVKYN